MNAKEEIAFPEKEQHIEEQAPVKDVHIENFINLIRKQSELNNHILSALSSPNVDKEDKLKMVQMLSGGAQNSSFFMQLIKKKEKDFDLGINESIPAKSSFIKDKFNKFKNMIISAKADIDPNITFRNPAQPDWYEVGQKVGFTLTTTSKIIHSTISSFLSQSANGVGLALKEFKKTKESLLSKFLLIGEKKNIEKLNKQFSKVFDLLGVDTNEMLHTNEMKKNLSEEELLNRISENLNKETSAVKDTTNGKFSFTILNGLTPELQFDMARTLIFPKLNNAIRGSMEMNYQIQASRDSNRYLQMVSEFAKENNFNPDLVIHSLRNNTNLLDGYTNFDKILKNKEQIIENADKYGKVVLNNFIYLESLVKACEDLMSNIKQLNIPQESKNEFATNINKTSILFHDGINVTYEQLKANLITIQPEEKEYTPPQKQKAI